MGSLRRVVTGHDTRGQSIVHLDERIEFSYRTTLWSTAASPADNAEELDGTQRTGLGVTSPGGTLFRIVELPAGDEPSSHQLFHRTQSVDYAIVLDGQVELQLDSGQHVTLGRGDVVIQRGTDHAWRVVGSQPCTMAFVLVAADPVVVQGRTLGPTTP